VKLASGSGFGLWASGSRLQDELGLGFQCVGLLGYGRLGDLGATGSVKTWSP
jgi:hypothetical protein